MAIERKPLLALNHHSCKEALYIKNCHEKDTKWQTTADDEPQQLPRGTSKESTSQESTTKEAPRRKGASRGS